MKTRKNEKYMFKQKFVIIFFAMHLLYVPCHGMDFLTFVYKNDTDALSPTALIGQALFFTLIFSPYKNNTDIVIAVLLSSEIVIATYVFLKRLETYHNYNIFLQKQNNSLKQENIELNAVIQKLNNRTYNVTIVNSYTKLTRPLLTLYADQTSQKNLYLQKNL